MILGIDPGKRGGIAALRMEDPAPVLRGLTDMPDNAMKLAEAISAARFKSTIDFAIIEDVHAMAYTDKTGKRRGQGAAASFSFGFDTGLIHGVLAANSIKIFKVSPSVWKLRMGLTSDKTKSLELARKLFPRFAYRFQKKKDDGLAEAALLAYYGAKYLRPGMKEVK